MGMSGGGGGGTNGGTGGAVYSLSAYLSGSGGASSSSVLTTLLLFKLSAVSFFNVGRREETCRPNMPTDPRMREEEEAAPIEVSRSAPSRLLMARSPRLETSANTEAINTDGHKDDARDEDDADADDVERGILKLISYPARLTCKPTA